MFSHFPHWDKNGQVLLIWIWVFTSILLGHYIINGYIKRLRERKIWLSNKSRSVFNKIQDQFKKQLREVKMNGNFLNLRCYQTSSLMSIYNTSNDPCTKYLSFCKGTRKRKKKRYEDYKRHCSQTIWSATETLANLSKWEFSKVPNISIQNNLFHIYQELTEYENSKKIPLTTIRKNITTS